MDVQKTGKFLVRNTARQLKIDDVAKKKKEKKKEEDMAQLWGGIVCGQA